MRLVPSGMVAMGSSVPEGPNVTGTLCGFIELSLATLLYAALHRLVIEHLFRISCTRKKPHPPCGVAAACLTCAARGGAADAQHGERFADCCVLLSVFVCCVLMLGGAGKITVTRLNLFC